MFRSDPWGYTALGEAAVGDVVGVAEVEAGLGVVVDGAGGEFGRGDGGEGAVEVVRGG